MDNNHRVATLSNTGILRDKTLEDELIYHSNMINNSYNPYI